MYIIIKKKDTTEERFDDVFGWCNGKGTFRFCKEYEETEFIEIDWDEVETIFFGGC